MDGVSHLDTYTPACWESKVGLDRDICGTNTSQWSGGKKVILCPKFKQSDYGTGFTPLP